jgi:hypothetical protein
LLLPSWQVTPNVRVGQVINKYKLTPISKLHTLNGQIQMYVLPNTYKQNKAFGFDEKETIGHFLFKCLKIDGKKS